MRKMVALVLVIPLLLLTVSPVKATANFSDTKDHWAATTIQWGIEQGVATGFPDGTFRPNNTVTEGEFLALLVRTFTTTKDGDPWYSPYYDLAIKNNYRPLSYSHNNVIRRTQVAEIVAGSQGLNFTFNHAIQYLLAKGLAKGYDEGVISIENYHGTDTLTRAQAIQFIKNLKDAGVQDIKCNPLFPSPLTEIPESSNLPQLPIFIDKFAMPDSPQYEKNHYSASLPLTLADGTIIESITIGKDGKHEAVVVKADRSASLSDAYLNLYFNKEGLYAVGNADTGSIWWPVGDKYEAYYYIYNDYYNKPYLNVDVNVPDKIGLENRGIYWVSNPLKK